MPKAFPAEFHRDVVAVAVTRFDTLIDETPSAIFVTQLDVSGRAPAHAAQRFRYEWSRLSHRSTMTDTTLSGLLN